MGLNPGGKRESPVLLAGACSERRHFFPQNWGKNRIWKEIPNLGIAYSQYFYTENMAGNLKGNRMMPSFSRQLVSHLRNASLTLCPRRSKFRLSTQSLPVMMCRNRIWQVCLLRCSSFCLWFSSIRVRWFSISSSNCDSLKISYGRSDGWHSKVWNFVPETSGWTPNWTVAWRCAGKFPILICSRESLYEESVPEQLLKLQKKYRMHSCRRCPLCVTVVSMKLLVVDVNRSPITNKCPAGTLVYFSRSIFVIMIIALIQWTDIWGAQ